MRVTGRSQTPRLRSERSEGVEDLRGSSGSRTLGWGRKAGGMTARGREESQRLQGSHYYKTSKAENLTDKGIKQ